LQVNIAERVIGGDAPGITKAMSVTAAGWGIHLNPEGFIHG
jgi:hypothetical protein